MNEDLECLEHRLWFLHKVLPLDDVYQFIDLLLQMNFNLSNVLHEFSNLDTVFAVYPEIYKSMKNLADLRARMIEKDLTVIDLQKFDLFD